MPVQHRLTHWLLVAFAALAPAGGQAQTQPVPEGVRILVLHGPNTNLFGEREPGVYGTTTFDQINQRLQALAQELGVDLEVLQSNHEGVLVDALQERRHDVDGALINPAGLSFYSVPLHDAVKAMAFPVIEVHISNLATRDEIHRHSIISSAALATVSGLGWRSYTAALRALVETVRETRDGDSSRR